MAPPTMHDIIEAAAAQRANLLCEKTTALRLIDGAGDGLPGVVIETFAGRLLLSTTGPRVPVEVRAWLEARGECAYWHEKWKLLLSKKLFAIKGVSNCCEANPTRMKSRTPGRN
jgi:23S rRNA G2069 N7-methylase RlmK/C1962 C5-methylase RlmI